MWHLVKYPFFFFKEREQEREMAGGGREREHMPEGRGGPEGAARERREGIPGRLYTQGWA